jgi:hypothetical protein
MGFAPPVKDPGIAAPKPGAPIGLGDKKTVSSMEKVVPLKGTAFRPYVVLQANPALDGNSARVRRVAQNFFANILQYR